MIKKYILLLTAAFSFLAGYSQGRNHLYITGGFTSPINSFQATEGSNGGYATEGYGVNIGFNRDFKRFYLGAQLSVLSNGFDKGKYDEMVLSNREAGTTSSTEHGGYGVFSTSVVIGYNFIKKPKLLIGAHIKPGIGFFAADDVKNITRNSDEVMTSHDGFQKASMIYGAGLKLEKSIDKNFALVASADYVFATVSESTSYRQYVNTNVSANEFRDVNINYGNVFYSVGVSYNF